MHALHKRYVVAIVALAIAAPLALFLQYSAPPPSSVEPLKELIPRAFGPWIMISEQGPTEKEKEILETDAILTRTYMNGLLPQVDLSVIFARDNRRVAHPPEVCYKGSGWNVENQSVVQFPVAGKPFHANQLLLVRGDRRLLVYYWFKAGPDYTASYWWMQLLIIRAQLLNRKSSSALVRVSAYSPEPNRDEEVAAVLRDFAALAIPPVTEAIP